MSAEHLFCARVRCICRVWRYQLLVMKGRWCPGVHRWVGEGGLPAGLPDLVIKLQICMFDFRPNRLDWNPHFWQTIAGGCKCVAITYKARLESLNADFQLCPWTLFPFAISIELRRWLLPAEILPTSVLPLCWWILCCRHFQNHATVLQFHTGYVCQCIWLKVQQ